MSKKNIDWSKAPKDAEFARHWGDEPGQTGIDFYKKDGYGGLLYLDGNTWDVALTKPNDPDLIPRPATWLGQGLPPVGTCCEWLDENSKRWVPIEIAFRSSWVIVVRDVNPHPDGPVDLAFDLTITQPSFRPAPTPEKIAAEDREKAAKQLCVDAGSPELTAGQMAIAYRLYDAGYRKADPAGAQP